MEITAWQVYWITRLDGLHALACVLAVLIGVVSLFCWIAVAEDDIPPSVPLIGHVLALLAAAVAILTPTTKEACAILVIPALANNEDVQALGGDIVTLAREWLDELRPEDGQ